ncbi:unnamed protein product [Pedinophyceae sp. YPF-701]|nr:unnamed protein product [Pedinophyceae sp. YPF-701]
MEIEGVSFEETGCTGRCADGPNATIESEGGSYDLMGLRSCRDVAEALSTKCGIEVDATLVSATDCRMAGVTAAMDGDFETAIKYFTKGIELNPPNVHTFYANRAVARLKNKDKSAMEDGQTALELAPEGWAEDWPWNTDISGLITEF